jgi:prefoldin beta subunit
VGLDLNKMSPDLQNKIMNFNNLRKTIDFLTQQKIEIERSMREAEVAIEELEKTESDTVVYKSIGGIFVKSDRDRLLEEKKSQKASLELKLKTVGQREERTKKQLETLSTAIEKDLKDQGIGLS